MEKQTISRDELHKVPHDLLVDMFLQLNSSLTIMQQQNETLIKQVSGLQESIAVLTQQRRTEYRKAVRNARTAISDI